AANSGDEGPAAQPEAVPPEKRPGKLKYSWPAAKEHFRKVFFERGEFRHDDIDSGWQTQADLEREVQEFLEKHDNKEPSEGQTRTYVSQWLVEWRAVLKNGTKADEG